MLVSSGEHLRVRGRIWMVPTVGVALPPDAPHSDDRALCKSFFEVGIFRLAFSEAKAPAVIVDHDIDVIGVVEGRRAPIIRRVIELSLRGRELPDELIEVLPVF